MGAPGRGAVVVPPGAGAAVGGVVGAGVVVGLWAGVVGLWAPFAGWLIDARPAFIGLTYGFGTGRVVERADVARDKTVSKLGRPSVDGFASGDPSGFAPRLSDLKAARPKTSSRMCSA